MGRKSNISREEILRNLQNFARENGRPPRSNESGFETIKEAAKRQFGSWEHALRIAGLQTYSAWRQRRTFAGQIRRLLDSNPMTMVELRQELKKYSEPETPRSNDISTARIISAIKQSSDIESTGPRRTKIYYLKGQETNAKARLDTIVSEIPPLEEEIFYHLRQPMKRGQLEKLVLGDTCSSYERAKVTQYLKELLLAGLIYKARFIGRAGHGRKRKFTSYDLFGDLAAQTFYCRYDCPNEVAQLVLSNIPHEELQNRDARISLVSARSHHLKRILPKDVFLIIDPELWARF